MNQVFNCCLAYLSHQVAVEQKSADRKQISREGVDGIDKNKKTMKKLIYAIAISGAVLGFQSCGNTTKNAEDAADTSAMATDTMISDDPAQVSPANPDTTFTNKAALSGMAEVEFGKLALEKGSHAKVKEFASMMVKDHSKANEELKTIAAAKSIMLPVALDTMHQAKYEELKSKSGADFDKAYTAAMVEGHHKTLALMEDGSQNLKDADLKAFAAKTSPVVKHHLEMINSIQTQLK